MFKHIERAINALSLSRSWVPCMRRHRTSHNYRIASSFWLSHVVVLWLHMKCFDRLLAYIKNIFDVKTFFLMLTSKTISKHFYVNKCFDVKWRKKFWRQMEKKVLTSKTVWRQNFVDEKVFDKQMCDVKKLFDKTFFDEHFF